MIEAKFFTNNKNILVVGAGRSGMAALRLLARQGCRLAVSDGGPLDRLDAEQQQWLLDKQVALEFDGHRTETFCRSHCIIVSPGVPLDLPQLAEARQSGIPVIGELELGALFTDVDIVAVTGTNGKTTVTTMIGAMLAADGKRVFVGGNIGTPLCDFVAREGKADVLVLEVSSFQLDSCAAFRPHVAVLLNISPDHLDRYASYAAYAEAKMQIFKRQRRHDFAVINGDDPEIVGRLSAIPSTIREFGRKKSCQARMAGNTALLQLPAEAVEEYSLPEEISTYPNCDNCLAAIMVARLMACRAEAVAQGLAAFRLLEHRLRTVAIIRGVTYIDDSKATNIGALQSALAGMTGPVHLIAGGRDKGGDYSRVSGDVSRRVKSLILIGEAADKMAAAWGEDVRVVRAASLEEAVRLAAGQAQSGETVLLSPACASFDMFSSYSERGRAFQEAVAALEAGPHLAARAGT
ncbi:MAG: UDP-N-acetylmuramoyl-L-alanine--D-glutamate ligase [Desulfobulbaceae bacterium]|nr:MAG: UDP-N-acetylmuramoyl-L-alanine--D-glutamate ligase [Desulfobulbaceae bacterium]